MINIMQQIFLNPDLFLSRIIASSPPDTITPVLEGMRDDIGAKSGFLI